MLGEASRSRTETYHNQQPAPIENGMVLQEGIYQIRFFRVSSYLMVVSLGVVYTYCLPFF
jgi:hypothetical protein